MQVLRTTLLAMMLSACASAPRTSAEARANPRELSSREQALHVLNRLSFGPRPGDVDRVLATGVDRWIDRQLQPERIPDPALDALLKAYPVLRMSANELAEEFPPPGAALRQARQRGDTALAKGKRVELARASRSIVGEITSARVARASVSERQLQEVMTDFWLNHFTVFVGKGQLRYTLPDYERESIRPFVFGRFRDLLGAVARSPAMLQYLDNVQSVADSGRRVSESRRVARRDRQARSRQRGLNENYARELLELHTLGVDGGYTQQDVIDVARALTGWTVGPPRIGTQGFVFNPAAHDAEEKLVLGHRLPAGRGIEDGEEVLDILARHPSTARFISRKLAIRFVSDAPSDELVDLAADVFRRSDGDIREVVRAIVTSSEFFSRAAYRAKVKSPFEVVVSALRAVDARPDTTPRTAAVVAQLGQPIYGHQAPNGWPETSEPWMNTGAILSRINFGLALAAGRVPGASLRQWPAFDTLSRRSAKEQVAGVVEAFLGGVVSAETRDVLESGVNPLLARAGTDSTFAIMEPDSVASASSAARERRRRVAGTAGAPVRLSGLSQTVGLALGSPEFQRR